MTSRQAILAGNPMSSIQILQSYLNLLATNKIQEACAAFGNRDQTTTGPILDQYIFACLQKRMGQKESAHSVIDAVAEPILAKAAHDGNSLDLIEEKIVACWIASVIERDALQANLERIGSTIACDYLIEDEISELYPLVAQAYKSIRN